MRIIITGGTGLIGRTLTTNLAADGHEVIILSRSPDTVTRLPAGVQVVGWDTRTATGWGDLADGAEAIVNLAGASIAGDQFVPSRWTPARKRLLRDSRKQASQAVIEAIERATQKPRVLIQSSAIGYYGPLADQIISEEAPPGDDFLARLCVEWEKAVSQADDLGLRVATIRTGVVLSLEGGALPRLLLPFKFFAGGPLGDGKQWLSWIHPLDEVAAIRFLIDNEAASGPFNLTAPEPLTNAEFSRTLGRVMKRPAFMPTPAFVLRLALGEVATVAVDGQRVIPKRLQALGFRFRFPEAEAALRDILT